MLETGNGSLMTQLPQWLPLGPVGLQNAAVAEGLFCCEYGTAQTAANEKVGETGQWESP